MILDYSIHGSMSLPTGSRVEGSEIVLPDGERLKLWEAVELVSDATGREIYRDLKGDELSDRGIDIGHKYEVNLIPQLETVDGT